MLWYTETLNESDGMIAKNSTEIPAEIASIKIVGVNYFSTWCAQ
jgi:hypothetical protein